MTPKTNPHVAPIKPAGSQPVPPEPPQSSSSQDGQTPPAEEPKPAAVVAPKFLERAGWGKKEKPEEKTPEPQPKDDKKQRKIAKGYEGAPPETPPAPPPPAPVDPTKIAEAAAAAASAAAVKAIREAPPAPPPPPPQPPEVQLDTQQKRDIAIFEEMGRRDPKYKDLATNAKSFLGELSKTAAKWEAEHPGEDFDVDGEEALALKEKYGYDWDESDFNQAERDLLLKEPTEKINRLESEVSMMKLERRNEQIKPKATEFSERFASEAVKEMAADIPEVVKDGKVDDAGLKKVTEEDPLIGDIVQSEREAARLFAEAVYTVANGGTHKLEHEPDPRTGKPVSQVSRLCWEIEKSMASTPAEQRPVTDREFLTRQQYFNMPAEEQDMLDSGRHPKYWVLTPDIIASYGAGIIADRAKSRISAIKERDKKLLGKASKATEPPPEPPPAPPPRPPSTLRPNRMPRPFSPPSVTGTHDTTASKPSSVPAGASKFIRRFTKRDGGVMTAAGKFAI